ncbi:ACP S-malonyltransferase [Thiomonas sp. FB-Cd]|uniref:ACP S-malonyltransferase n=1 Tax=Thiomonas sp. FB-Cd TaxID=1158292 RepID=UPI0004DF4E63|nr:malonate decarboxylase subunit epsilon [Thiomonas sp. FB-Cd]
MRIAFLCPGQGSQTEGYLHRLVAHARVQETLEEASTAVQMDLCQADHPEALRSTVAVQLGIVTAGVAMARALQAEGVVPDVVAGLSVGAFTAAVVAGCLRFDDALRVVFLRAHAMAAGFPRGYGMVAISGLSQPAVEALIAELNASRAAADDHAYLANLNSPWQFVVAGCDLALEDVIERARAGGARMVERLPVSVPSHCVLLAGVAETLRGALSQCALQAPVIPYVANGSARLLRTAQEVAQDLAQSVMQPVRWHECNVTMLEHGVQLFIEMPPNQVLTQLVKNLTCSVEAVAADTTNLRSMVFRAQRAQQGRDS